MEVELRTKVFLLPLVFVASCGISPDRVQPAVSQYNGDSVSIQLNGNAVELMGAPDRQTVFSKADAEAARICSKGHKKKAE